MAASVAFAVSIAIGRSKDFSDGRTLRSGFGATPASARVALSRPVDLQPQPDTTPRWRATVSRVMQP
jgi:hypothetical protein